MAIRARLQNDREILVDFGTPVLSMGVQAQQFEVTGSQVSHVTFSSDQYAVLTLQSNPPDGELWLLYQATNGGAQILRTAPVPEPVLSFEVLVTEPGATQQYDVTNTSDLPTLGDFIDAYTLKEAIEITTNSAEAQQPDELKFLRAIEDAEALWNAELLMAPAASRLLLNPGKRRSLLTIARYYLDQAGCPRPHVTAAYTEVLRAIRSATGSGGDSYTGDDSDFFFFGTESCGGQGSCAAPNPRPQMNRDPWLY